MLALNKIVLSNPTARGEFSFSATQIPKNFTSRSGTSPTPVCGVQSQWVRLWLTNQHQTKQNVVYHSPTLVQNGNGRVFSCEVNILCPDKCAQILPQRNTFQTRLVNFLCETKSGQKSSRRGSSSYVTEVQLTNIDYRIYGIKFVDGTKSINRVNRCKEGTLHRNKGEQNLYFFVEIFSTPYSSNSLNRSQWVCLLSTP